MRRRCQILHAQPQCKHIQCNTELFHLDSACSLHICNNQSMLHDKQQRTTHFTVPGGGTVMSHEFGTIKLKLWNITKQKYDTLTINNVAYQPKSNNLLSLGKLNRQGLHVDTEHYVLYRRMSDATRHDYKILPTQSHMLLLEAQSICSDGTLIPRSLMQCNRQPQSLHR